MTTQGYWASAPMDEIGEHLVRKVERYYDWTRSSGQFDLWNAAYESYFSGAIDNGKLGVAGRGGDPSSIRMKVSHVRNVGQHLLAAITRQKLAFQPKAINTDSTSIAQTQLATGVLEYDVSDKRLGSIGREVADVCIGLGEGTAVLEWDENGGDDVEDPETGEVVKAGCLKLSPYTPDNVIRDHTKLDNKSHQWFIIRKFVNRYDLAAQVMADINANPEATQEEIEKAQTLHDAILALEVTPNDPKCPILGGQSGISFEADDWDIIPVYYFYHKPSPALETGRLTAFLPTGHVLRDEALDDVFPVFRMHAAPFWNRPFSYTNIFDTLSIQQGVNALYSSIATNNTLSVGAIAVEAGSEVEALKGGGGVKLFRYPKGGTRPEPINFVSTKAETFNFVQMLERAIETLSGVNSTARGDPGANLKSGAALALVAAQALEFAGPLQASYVDFWEELATAVVKLYQRNATVPQMALIVGKSQRAYTKQFVGDDIKRITRVTVELANPLSSSLAGRVQIGQELLQAQMIKNPQEYLTLLNTGRLEAMTEHDTSELLCIRTENERLRDGEEVGALALDNHALHIKEHLSVISSPEAREDVAIAEATYAHIMEHTQLWQNADPVLLQALGIPPLAPPMPPGGPVPPGPGGAPDAAGAMPMEGAAPVAQMPSMPTNPLTGEPAADPVSSQMPNVAPPADAV